MKKRIIIAFILIMLKLIGYCQSESDSLRTIETLKDTINGIYIPKNLDECFIQINGFWNDSIKSIVREWTEEEFLANVHFGFGMWIRNNWGLWGGSRLQVYFHSKGIYHPDAMSSIILSSYYRDLNGARIKLNKQIRQTKYSWKSYENREPEEMFIAKTVDKIEYNDIASAMDHSEDITDISLIRYKKIPKAIKKFKNLNKISFEDCQSIDLERTISLISSIEHLENLYFFKNGFNIYPENIGDINGLKTLWIDGDSIKYLPNSIRKLTSLAELNITECYNLDFRFLFDQIISLDSLTELNFSENGLKDLPENIDQLKNIKEIWLDDNLLIEIPNGIKKLHKLEYLRLFDNKIDSLNIASGDLPNLKNINLCYNNFQTFPMELAYLNRLERVSMWSCEITTIPSEISILSQLKYLNLRWNNLSQEQKIRLTKQLPFTELILE